MTYTQAVTELEQLVQKMQDPQCSIDNLTAYTKASTTSLPIPSAARNSLTSAARNSPQPTSNSSRSSPTSSSRGNQFLVNWLSGK